VILETKSDASFGRQPLKPERVDFLAIRIIRIWQFGSTLARTPSTGSHNGERKYFPIKMATLFNPAM